MGFWWLMNGKTTLKRLERLRRRLDEDAQQDGFAPIPVRYYELNAAGERVYLDPNEDDLALEEKFWRLVARGRAGGL